MPCVSLVDASVSTSPRSPFPEFSWADTVIAQVRAITKDARASLNHQRSTNTSSPAAAILERLQNTLRAGAPSNKNEEEAADGALTFSHISSASASASASSAPLSPRSPDAWSSRLAAVEDALLSASRAATLHIAGAQRELRRAAVEAAARVAEEDAWYAASASGEPDNKEARAAASQVAVRIAEAAACVHRAAADATVRLVAVEASVAAARAAAREKLNLNASTSSAASETSGGSDAHDQLGASTATQKQRDKNREAEPTGFLVRREIHEASPGPVSLSPSFTCLSPVTEIPRPMHTAPHTASHRRSSRRASLFNVSESAEHVTASASSASASTETNTNFAAAAVRAQAASARALQEAQEETARAREELAQARIERARYEGETAIAKHAAELAESARAEAVAELERFASRAAEDAKVTAAKVMSAAHVRTEACALQLEENASVAAAAAQFEVRTRAEAAAAAALVKSEADALERSEAALAQATLAMAQVKEQALAAAEAAAETKAMAEADAVKMAEAHERSGVAFAEAASLAAATAAQKRAEATAQKREEATAHERGRVAFAEAASLAAATALERESQIRVATVAKAKADAVAEATAKSDATTEARLDSKLARNNQQIEKAAQSDLPALPGVLADTASPCSQLTAAAAHEPESPRSQLPTAASHARRPDGPRPSSEPTSELEKAQSPPPKLTVSVPPSSSPSTPNPLPSAYSFDPTRNVVLGLLRGTAFIKHGRKGWPHARLLWLDVTHAELGLRWGEPGKGITDANAPWMSLGEVQSVVRGRATPVLKRSAKAAAESKCFALIAATRSLDFEAPNQDSAELWSSALMRLFGEPNLLQRLLMDIVNAGEWALPT